MKGKACSQPHHTSKSLILLLVQTDTSHSTCCYHTVTTLCPSASHKQKHIYMHKHLTPIPTVYACTDINSHSTVSFCDEEWSVQLEFCGVFQQVFICQFSGCCCLALLKTSHGISWRCHGCDTTSDTYTCTHTLTRAHVCMNTHRHTHKYICDSNHVTPEMFITKNSSNFQKYTCTNVCFEIRATLDLLFDFLPLWAYNSASCGQSGPMCFAVVCGVEVMTERGREAFIWIFPAWLACLFASMILSLCAYLLVSGLLLSYLSLSVHLTLPAFQPVSSSL